MTITLEYYYDPSYANSYWVKMKVEGVLTDWRYFCGTSFDDAKRRALEGAQPFIERLKIKDTLEIPPTEVIEIV